MSFWKLTGPRKSLPNNTVYIFTIQTGEFCTHPQTRLWARICSNYIYQNPLPPHSTPIMWSLFPWENELVCISWTRKHSSTACSTRLEAVHVSVSWLRPDVTPGVYTTEHIWTGIQWLPPYVTGRGSSGLMSKGYPTWPFGVGGYPTWPVLGGTLPCDLSHYAFDITYPLYQ